MSFCYGVVVMAVVVMVVDVPLECSLSSSMSDSMSMICSPSLIASPIAMSIMSRDHPVVMSTAAIFLSILMLMTVSIALPPSSRVAP